MVDSNDIYKNGIERINYLKSNRDELLNFLTECNTLTPSIVKKLKELNKKILQAELNASLLKDTFGLD